MDGLDDVPDRLPRSSLGNLAAKCSSAWTVSLTGMVPDEVKVVLSGP